jgi:hypothetical protein
MDDPLISLTAKSSDPDEIKKLSKQYDKHVIDLQFKRSRQQIVETLNLVRVQTTKVIKEQYKIKLG